MRIDFNEPYSIKELVQSYNKVATDDSQFKVYQPSERWLKIVIHFIIKVIDL